MLVGRYESARQNPLLQELAGLIHTKITSEQIRYWRYRNVHKAHRLERQIFLFKMWFLKYYNGLQTPKENSTRKRRRKEKKRRGTRKKELPLMHMLVRQSWAWTQNSLLLKAHVLWLTLSLLMVLQWSYYQSAHPHPSLWVWHSPPFLNIGQEGDKHGGGDSNAATVTPVSLLCSCPPEYDLDIRCIRRNTQSLAPILNGRIKDKWDMWRMKKN